MAPTKKRKKRVEDNVVKGPPNRTILLFAIAMIIFGAIMIFDASVYQANQVFSDPFYFLKLHLFWIFIGVAIGIPIILWDYRQFTKFITPVLIINIILLVAVLFTQDTNGSRRWLSLGSERIVIQPAEFIKPVFIMYIATWLAKERKTYSSFNEALKLGFGKKLAGFGVTLGAVLLLILLEPDLGTTLIIAVTAFAIFLASGTDIAHLVGSAIVGVILFLLGVLAAIIAPYRLTRVQTYLNLLFTGQIDDPQGAGYQINQILIGIGSAGLWGKGFGQSRQRFGYLVELTAFTDSIYAVILEEMGMIGGVIFIAAWLLFLWFGLKVAQRAPDRQGRLIAIGITVWLTVQALFNMAANVGLIPLTGMPLPFVSYGGSGTVVAIIGIAILLNISRFRKSEKAYT